MSHGGGHLGQREHGGERHAGVPVRDAGYRNSSRTTEKSSSNTCRPVKRSANASSTLTREAPAGVGVRTTSRSWDHSIAPSGPSSSKTPSERTHSSAPGASATSAEP